jgi:hypothetical protein
LVEKVIHERFCHGDVENSYCVDSIHDDAPPPGVDIKVMWVDVQG